MIHKHEFLHFPSSHFPIHWEPLAMETSLVLIWCTGCFKSINSKNKTRQQNKQRTSPGSFGKKLGVDVC